MCAAVLWVFEDGGTRLFLGDKQWTVAYICEWIQQKYCNYSYCFSAQEGHGFALRDCVYQLGIFKKNCVVDGWWLMVYIVVAFVAWGLIHDLLGVWLGGFYVGILGGDPLLVEIHALKIGLLIV